MFNHKLYLGLTNNRGESINRDIVINWLVVQLSQHGLKGGNFTSGLGLWEGKIEQTLILSVFDDRDLASVFRLISRIYAHDFLQDAVLFEQQNVTAEFIS